MGLTGVDFKASVWNICPSNSFNAKTRFNDFLRNLINSSKVEILEALWFLEKKDEGRVERIEE